MKIKKSIKIVLIIILIAVIGVIGSVIYIFNQPKRDVQAAQTDFSYSASEIVNEYLTDADKANEKYLDEEGESKIIEISGQVASISEDFNNRKVVLLQSPTDKAGVSCTFTEETGAEVATIKIGDQVTIKGVIRSGANYIEDIDIYENVIISESKIISKQ